jgi:methyl-accepting chemotaxis protein
MSGTDLPVGKAGAGRGRRTKRRRYLVHRKNQLRFTSKLLLLVFAMLAVQIVLTHVHLLTVQSVVTEAPVSDPEALKAIDKQLGRWHGWWHLVLLAALLVVAVLLTLTGIVTSHRLTGPVLRLSRHFEGPPFATAGSFAFRRSDHLAELAAALNGAEEALEQRRQELAAILGGLADNVSRLNRESSPDMAYELVQEMEELLRRLTALMESAAEI